ncbi:MAG: hypothetical protein WB919_08455 [Candidatus Sulfotelmatobacter sp.]
MTGSWWRLLAAVLLILVATVISRGQDAAAERAAVGIPALATTPQARLLDNFRFPERIGIPKRPVAPVTIGLPQIVHASGIIFSGRVMSVGRSAGAAATPIAQGAAFTTITFQVEDAVRGVFAGQTLTIHEWAGLWARGERYHVGERVVLFLYSPSKIGLTSPVAGPGGKFAIDPAGTIVMSAHNVATLASDSVVGGRARIPYGDFAEAVRRAGIETNIKIEK